MLHELTHARMHAIALDGCAGVGCQTMTRRLAIAFLLAPFIALTIIGSNTTSGQGGAAASAPTVSAMGNSFTGTVVQDGSGPRVALVKVSGAISSGDSTSTMTGGDTLVAELEAIRRSDRYRGVILELDTPGGAVLPSAEVSEEVRKLRDDGIKVLAWMRGTTASGGYYIASQADRIVAAPDTLTGSIGVILEYFDASGLARKVGVQPIVIKSGALKDMGSPFRDLTAEERRVLQKMIDEAYARFVDAVASGRDLDRAEVRSLADGRIYTGEQAAKNGLVDELGTRSEAYAALAKLLDRPAAAGRSLHVVTYERRLGLLDQLLAVSSRPLTLADVVRHGAGGDSGVTDAATFSGFRISYRSEVGA